MGIVVRGGRARRGEWGWGMRASGWERVGGWVGQGPGAAWPAHRGEWAGRECMRL